MAFVPSPWSTSICWSLSRIRGTFLSAGAYTRSDFSSQFECCGSPQYLTPNHFRLNEHFCFRKLLQLRFFRLGFFVRLCKTLFASRPWCASKGVSSAVAFVENRNASNALSSEHGVLEASYSSLHRTCSPMMVCWGMY